MRTTDAQHDQQSRENTRSAPHSQTRAPRRAPLRGLAFAVITALITGAGFATATPVYALTPPRITEEQPTPIAPQPTDDPGSENPTPQTGTTDVPVNSEFTLVPGSTSNFAVSLPEGMTPASVRATITGTPGETLQINSSQRVLGVVGSESGPIDIAVTETDISETGDLTLSFSYQGFADTWCAVDGTAAFPNSTITVSDLTVAATGEAALPTSVSEFLTGAQTAVVEIPAEHQTELAFAALDMVAGASNAIGQESDVRLVVAGSPEAEQVTAEFAAKPALFHRLITLQHGEGETVTGIDRNESGIARLSLTGSPAALVSSAAAFGTPGIALASAAETTGLSARSNAGEPTAAEVSRTLADLGVETISLEGYGSSDAYVALSQSSFGGMLDSIDVHLTGTVSSTVETIATVQVLWNSVLVDSFPVDASESVIDRTITVPAAALRSGNGLVIRMQAVNAAQVCVDERLLPKIRMDIATSTSTVTAHRGSSPLAGFQDFPQAFTGTAQVAFGAEPSGTQLSAAAQLVAALQRAQPDRLSFAGVSAADLLADARSGILLGATADQAQQLRTPLRFAELRRIDSAGEELTVAVAQPYAALQAVRHNDRSLLVLGEYPGDSESSAQVLRAATSELPGMSWQQLNGAVRLATPNADPIVLDVNEIIPQAEAKADFQPVAWWTIAFLVLLIVVGIFAARLRKRRTRIAARTVQSELDNQNHVSSVNTEDTVADSPITATGTASQPAHAAPPSPATDPTPGITDPKTPRTPGPLGTDG